MFVLLAYDDMCHTVCWAWHWPNSYQRHDRFSLSSGEGHVRFSSSSGEGHVQCTHIKRKRLLLLDHTQYSSDLCYSFCRHTFFFFSTAQTEIKRFKEVNELAFLNGGLPGRIGIGGSVGLRPTPCLYNCCI